MNDANREQPIAAAELLGPVLGELVFVGGCVTGLLITDEAAGAPRSTLAVDAIVEISSYADYAGFGGRLRRLGFEPDTREGAPLCRWVHDRTTLDVMPLDEKIPGFSNRWYRDAIASAATHALSPGLEIRAVTAPLFVATKPSGAGAKAITSAAMTLRISSPSLMAANPRSMRLTQRAGNSGRTSRRKSAISSRPRHSSMRCLGCSCQTRRVRRESPSCSGA